MKYADLPINAAVTTTAPQEWLAAHCAVNRDQLLPLALGMVKAWLTRRSTARIELWTSGVRLTVSASSEGERDE